MPSLDVDDSFGFVFAIMAGLFDVAANLASTKSNGFAKRGWGLLSIALVVVAFALLAEAFKSIDMASAYATLGATGIFGTAICGRYLFGNRLRPMGILGLVVVFAAVVVLHSASDSSNATAHRVIRQGLIDERLKWGSNVLTLALPIVGEISRAK